MNTAKQKPIHGNKEKTSGYQRRVGKGQDRGRGKRGTCYYV